MQITASNKSIEAAEVMLVWERSKMEVKLGPITWDKYRIRGTAKTGFKLVQQGRLK